MTKKHKNTDHDAAEEPLAGIDAVFRGLGGFVELLGNLVEQGERQVERQGEFRIKGLGDQAQGVYGVSIRTGRGGTPEVRRFGNLRTTAKGPVVSDVREPLVDVFDEGEDIVVTAELPGVAEEELTLSASGSVLTLETSGSSRYAREIPLPAPVDPRSLRHGYRNGILRVQLKKA
jgi:HSP20 family protein